jgi:hypothetical protein
MNRNKNKTNKNTYKNKTNLGKIKKDFTSKVIFIVYLCY